MLLQHHLHSLDQIVPCRDARGRLPVEKRDEIPRAVEVDGRGHVSVIGP